MGNASPTTAALQKAEEDCAPLKTLFEKCKARYETERKAENKGRDGWDNLAGFAASPCQVLFDDYRGCITDEMEKHVASLREQLQSFQNKVASA